MRPGPRIFTPGAEVSSLRDNLSTSPPKPQIDSPPHSEGPQFDRTAWMQAFIKARKSSGTALPALGFAFHQFTVRGNGQTFQSTVANAVVQALAKFFRQSGKETDVLLDLEGVVNAGESLLVLGPQGSGCSTFLRTVSGAPSGTRLADGSYLDFGGIGIGDVLKANPQAALYIPEADAHVPGLTAGDTLSFAARANTNALAIDSEPAVDAVMSMLGIGHTKTTLVGSGSHKGLSGGEMKRLSIAEALLQQAALCCWDNSTCGLDSISAMEFCRVVQMEKEMRQATACVAVNNMSESAYQLFDKVLVLYGGRQIYFGPTAEAARYFEKLGFERPRLQTTPDFLTSMANAASRRAQTGHEGTVPQSAAEFASCWKQSPARDGVLAQLLEHKRVHARPTQHWQTVRRYPLSFLEQLSLCLWRGARLLRRDPGLLIGPSVGGLVTALICGSVFYNQPNDTSSFFGRSALMFFTVLVNSFSTSLEILSLYQFRPIIARQTRAAWYRPSAEALASMLVGIPYKLLNAITFNVTAYFLANLRRTPAAFFTFFCVSFCTTMTMSSIFRAVAVCTSSATQALIISTLLILAIPVYSGFPLPSADMQSWLRWIKAVDPVSYSFEALMGNEFGGRTFPCVRVVPSGAGYASIDNASQTTCAVIGADGASTTVHGSAYLASVYGYTNARLGHNVGILIAFMLGFTLVCLAASELMPAPRPSSEVLVKLGRRKRRTQDVEGKGGDSGSSEALWRGFAQAPSIVEKRKDSSGTLYWSDLSLRVSKGKSTLQLLDRVDGWVKPGSVTALMGVSGAGKTTLLDTLASRTAVGVVTGEIWLGKATTKRELRARDMGYVQQKDMHLPTSSVREALTFSALVRQRSGSGAERRQYVDEVIALLGLEDCADAVIGENGESLNARQRKMLAIGIELAAKPDVLLFLDEPTSGQDAQAAWNMVAIFRQIANAGLGVLCTIHQPSGLLLEQFDSLLLLAQGGRTVYFGDVGQDLDTVVQYFVRNGAEELRPGTNPAEWILHLANAPASPDWPAIWRGSPEYVSIKEELRENDRLVVSSEVEALTQTPFWTQFRLFARRTLQNYWRTPWYIYSKAALCCWSALFVGFSFFNAPTSLQGLQNQMLAVFMLCTIGSQLAQQMLAQYVPLRNLFEVYELPAGAYSWPAFLVSHVLIEQLWNSLMAVVIFFCWFYPVGFTDALDADDAHSRSATMFLFLWLFLAFVGSLELLAAAAANSAEGAGNLSNLAFTLSLLFCGILASPDAMPRFWIFMYRVSPFTYIVEGILSVGLAGKRVTCADNEILTMQPRQDETCGEYLSAYVRRHGGEVLDAAATRDCRYCPVKDSGAYLSQSHIEYGHRWRNVGILLAYIAFNIGVAFFLHWHSRFRKREAKKRV